MMRVVTASWLLLSGLAISSAPNRRIRRGSSCATRLQQEARLSEEELARLCNEIIRTIEGKSFRIKDGEATRELSAEQRAVVFGMLSNRAGLFDEGLRQDGGTTYRVLNGPGRSNNAEIEASQRLWIDVETLLPLRYQFTYAFPGYGDYAYELIPDH